MKALYKNKEVEVWQISKNDLTQPLWIAEAFTKNYLHWLDNSLRILIPALYPNWSKDIIITVMECMPLGKLEMLLI